MQLYCSRYLNNAYSFYWKLMGLCYADPPFSQLAKVLTKIALEGARANITAALSEQQDFQLMFQVLQPATMWPPGIFASLWCH